MQEIRPDYYKDASGKECIDYMVEQFGAEAVKNFCEVNAFKYRFRAGHKPGEPKIKDLAKAEYYERKAKELKG